MASLLEDVCPVPTALFCVCIVHYKLLFFLRVHAHTMGGQHVVDFRRCTCAEERALDVAVVPD